MKKRLVVLILLMVTILLISSCDEEAIPGELSPQDQITKACEETTDDREKTECYLDFATDIKDPGFCEQLTDTHIKDLCYMGAAVGTADSSLCEKITDSIITENDISISIKEVCHINVAEAMEDEAEEAVHEASTRTAEEEFWATEDGLVDCEGDDECFNQRFKACKPTKVEGTDTNVFIEGIEGETCVLRYSAELDETAYMTCKVPDYATLELDDPELNMMQYCEGPLADIYKEEENPTKTVEDCEKIAETEERNHCYRNAARAAKDFRICDKITENFRVEECYTAVVQETKEPVICEVITSSHRKDACYELIAPATKDPSMCEKITTISVKDQCHLKVAKEINDAAPCEEITDSGLTDSCYQVIAIATKDTSLCEKISYDAAKNVCYEGIQ